MRIQDLKLLLLLQFVALIQANTKSVFLYNNVGQLVTSDTLNWQSFTDDPKQNKYAVEAGQFQSDRGNSSLFVCRVVVDGIPVTGFTLKQITRTVCVVTMHMNGGIHHAFDILLNNGDAGKLTWTKSSGVIPVGAISATSSAHVSAKHLFSFIVILSIALTKTHSARKKCYYLFIVVVVADRR